MRLYANRAHEVFATELFLFVGECHFQPLRDAFMKFFKIFITILAVYGLINAAISMRLYFLNIHKSQQQTLRCIAVPALDSCLKQYSYLMDADKNAHDVVSQANKLHNKVNK